MADSNVQSAPSAACPPAPVRRHHAFLILAVFVAAFLRLFLLHAIPPGLHYDLATNLLIGSDIAFGTYRPIFITAFTGREVLFFYWLAGLMRFVGPNVFTLHLAGSLIGLLTVPATYFAVRHVFAHDRNRNWLAALSAALLAGNLWQVHASRFTLHASFYPSPATRHSSPSPASSPASPPTPTSPPAPSQFPSPLRCLCCSSPGLARRYHQFSSTFFPPSWPSPLSATSSTPIPILF
ncbi:MAG: hypothetical protein HY260_21480 [Chloroflexi bacterium]|nr:hypothetical protein [Chloroflexota bacterium]